MGEKTPGYRPFEPIQIRVDLANLDNSLCQYSNPTDIKKLERILEEIDEIEEKFNTGQEALSGYGFNEEEFLDILNLENNPLKKDNFEKWYMELTENVWGKAKNITSSEGKSVDIYDMLKSLKYLEDNNEDGFYTYNGKIKEAYQEIYEEIGSIVKNLDNAVSALKDKDALLEQYFQQIKEFGEEEFRERLKYSLKDYFGFDQIYEKIKDKNSFEDIAKTLRSVRREELPAFEGYKFLEEQLSERENEYKARQKKKIKNEIKEEQHNLLSIAEYFSPSFSLFERASKKFEKQKNKLEAILHEYESMNKNGYIDFILDPTYEPETDFNAGRISEDCTKEAPLPFHDEKVHNLKIYLKTNNISHIGNIYLLESQKDEEDLKNYSPLEVDNIPDMEMDYEDLLKVNPYLLHIDALQCKMLSQDDTQAFLQMVLPEIKDAYEKSTGTSGIKLTMNPEQYLKSEHEEVRKGIELYTGQNDCIFGFRDTTIDLFRFPRFEQKYDSAGSFQMGGPGEVRKVQIIYE